MSSPAAGPGRQADPPLDVVERLAASYDQVSAVAHGLTGASAMLPSRCAGWAIADVLYHQLLDARRALITFASPSAAQPDVDAVTYWRAYGSSADSPQAPGGEGAARHARYVRIAAAAYEVPWLAAEWQETSAATVRAARACPYDAVATQGHTLATADFIHTLVVESAVHYLDLTVSLPAAAPPDAAALALVRDVLTGLAGLPLPPRWDDETCALKGTGRLPVTDDERATLGPVAGMLPLFG
jgi:hypothetical protein